MKPYLYMDGQLQIEPSQFTIGHLSTPTQPSSRASLFPFLFFPVFFFSSSLQQSQPRLVEELLSLQLSHAPAQPL